MDSVRAKHMEEQLLGLRVGEWEIIKLLGHGKSALVFRAENKGQSVALKIFDPEIIERFGAPAQEARIQRELTLVGQ